MNWPQNDYWLGPLLGVAPDVAAEHLRPQQGAEPVAAVLDADRGAARRRRRRLARAAAARRPRRHRRRAGEGGLRPRGAAHQGGVHHHRAAWSAPRPACRRPAPSREAVTAARFDDSVGVGAYRIDLHPSTGGRNYVDVSSLPFQIPLGALIPQRVENLIPACKNIGTTHLTNGCYRLHPVEWTIGEAAGALVAHATQAGEPPRQIRNDPKRAGRVPAGAAQPGLRAGVADAAAAVTVDQRLTQDRRKPVQSAAVRPGPRLALPATPSDGHIDRARTPWPTPT